VSDHEPASVVQRLAIYLDPSSDEPMYRQIVDRLWLEIITGTVETGERLPTVRQMAIELGVRPATVTRAYKELELLGVLITRPGHGSFVGLSSPDATALERQAQLERLCRDLETQGEALGFTLTELIDALRELRSAERDPQR
jgi:GntR family transcriptional regulator